jgi:hypothetical protein
MPKRSRLAEEKSPVGFGQKKQNGGQIADRKPEKKRPRDGHSNSGSSGFRWGTVIMFILQQGSEYRNP